MDSWHIFKKSSTFGSSLSFSSQLFRHELHLILNHILTRIITLQFVSGQQECSFFDNELIDTIFKACSKWE